jgi:drug/metabolite transporter (DMT)-like permease
MIERPLLFLFSFSYGFYTLRHCFNKIDSLSITNTILIRQLIPVFAAIFLAGMVTFFLYVMFVKGVYTVYKELSK